MSVVDDLARRFPALLMARRNLSRNQLRSGLAALGIIIGVFAIASLGMFGTTLRAGATGELGDIGNEVVVSPAFSEGVVELTDRDVTRIERAATGTTVVPVKQRQSLVTRGDERTVTTLYGMEQPGALYTATDGRAPDRLRQGAVVGAGLAERFGLQAGNSISVDDKSYRVVAVLAQVDGITLVNPNNAVIVAPSEFETDGYSQVVVAAPTGEAASAAAENIRDSLNGREERVTVFELSSITEGINVFFGILNAFLLGIGSISLIVAGVSILNVMLMSTVERREEIGVLRAVGVQKRDVIRMILLEAALLGLVGGLVGAALALAAGLALNQFVLNDVLVTFQPINVLYLVLAVAFGLTTSVLSGLYPAWKAASERPVDALRK
ncbi:putative ABC transport system permease protein [Halogranum gelatinilyticum]|uniref:Putative ABC transport system permease protein n=1 Tax=Halogranum gelatinilyticum TaxID=660521 RepID=A0A1G9R9F5_9EURY|nr:ABC transporter permease [Halogranum gelatinilyticum]SDM19863.1 putative ABC transport system permease protein [Halogranum gelatinilyticum]